MRKYIELWHSYFCPGFLGTAASVIGIGAGLNSLFGGSGGGSAPNGGASNGYGSGVPMYQPTGQASADAMYQALLAQINGSASGVGGQVNPLLQQTLQNQLGINYGGLQGAANASGQASTLGGNQDLASALQLLQQGQTAQSQGQQAFNAGQQVYQTALDPQSALFNQQQQLVTDQTNAGQAARGIGNSPVGASELQQNLSNFDINWQQNQLSRQAMGAQALNAGNASANQSNQLMGADLSGASALNSAGASSLLAGGQTPLSAQQTAAAAPGQAGLSYANGIGTANQPNNNVMADILQYLGYGSSSAQNAYGAFAGQQAFGAGQQAAGANGLIQGLNGLNNSGGGAGVGGWLSSLSQPNYGTQTQQNNSQMGDPTSTVQNYPGA